MNIPLPTAMRAVAMDPAEALVRVSHAGIGTWDAFEREGGYARMTGVAPSFPYIGKVVLRIA